MPDRTTLAGNGPDMVADSPESSILSEVALFRASPPNSCPRSGHACAVGPSPPKDDRQGVDPPAGFSSNAEFVKSRTNGPTAKSFNTNFAALYDRIGEARSTPSNLWCGDEKARQVVEQLNRDAGYEPVYAGPLENAALQEDFLKLVFAINQGGWADSSIGWRLPINSESTVSRSRGALARTSSPSRCSRDASQAESRYALSIEELSPEPLISYEPLAPAERCQLQLLGLFAGHLPP
jgi:hypothetical protein